jgi:POT family proton-dependent oligopeptide transporter
MSSTTQKHPKGLYVLFATEMWERFNYYGMRAILVLFLTKALLLDKVFASQLYGSYTGLIYLTPLLGGYIADRYWGNNQFNELLEKNKLRYEWYDTCIAFIYNDDD